jgi:hypothetical protein
MDDECSDNTECFVKEDIKKKNKEIGTLLSEDKTSRHRSMRSLIICKLLSRI